jgi:hypothetical protein
MAFLVLQTSFSQRHEGRPVSRTGFVACPRSGHSAAALRIEDGRIMAATDDQGATRRARRPTPSESSMPPVLTASQAAAA